MIAICCKLYARLGCGLRGIGKVFDTISEELPFLLGEAPSHTTIADWIRVYGLALYSQACKEIAGMRYAIIVDESITIGSQKLLLVLGVPAEHLGRPLQHSDVRVLGIEVASSWPACDVELVLRNIIDTVGHEPEYVLSDNGHNLTRATRELNLIHHRDITHTCGCILKDVYGEDPRFLDFTQKLGKVRLQYHLTPLAYLLPPNQRSISRFLNCFKWVEWAEKMSAVLPRLSVKEQETYAFLCDYEGLIRELSVIMKEYKHVESIVKNKGLSWKTAIECKKHIVQTIAKSDSQSVRRVGLKLAFYLDEEAQKFQDSDVVINLASDVIESMFGTYKDRISPNHLYGVTSFVLFIPVHARLVNDTASKTLEVEELFPTETLADTRKWRNENLLTNWVARRSQILRQAA